MSFAAATTIHHDGRWDDLRHIGWDFEDDASVGGVKHRLEPSGPADFNSIDERGDEGPRNEDHSDDDLSHQLPRGLSNYGSSAGP